MAYKNIYFICSQVDLSTEKEKVTGQSVITNYVVNILKEEYIIFFKLHKTNQNKKLDILFNLIRQISSIFFSNKNYKFAYFVISRSQFGFIRDSLLIITCLLKRIKVIIHIHGSDILFTRDYSQIHKYFLKLLKFTINIVPSKTLKNELKIQNINSIVLSNFSTLLYFNKNKNHEFWNKKRNNYFMEL